MLPSENWEKKKYLSHQPPPQLICLPTTHKDTTTFPHPWIFIHKLCRGLFIACEAVTVWTDLEASFFFFLFVMEKWDQLLPVNFALNSKWTLKAKTHRRQMVHVKEATPVIFYVKPHTGG